MYGLKHKSQRNQSQSVLRLLKNDYETFEEEEEEEPIRKNAKADLLEGNQAEGKIEAAISQTIPLNLTSSSKKDG